MEQASKRRERIDKLVSRDEFACGLEFLFRRLDSPRHGQHAGRGRDVWVSAKMELKWRECRVRRKVNVRGTEAGQEERLEGLKVDDTGLPVQKLVATSVITICSAVLHTCIAVSNDPAAT